MSIYDPPEETLERFGERFTLERSKGGLYSICRYSPGGCMGVPATKDEAGARKAWAALLSLPRCGVCGDPPIGSWEKNAQAQMSARGLCFFCNHWTNTIAEMDSNDCVIDGSLYSIGEAELSIAQRCHWPTTKDGRLPGGYRHVLGHGGAEFQIEFFDGRNVKTTNLWAAGPIPSEFRPQLPDNARFISREHSRAYVGSGSGSL